MSEPHADSDGARRLAELVESMPTVETAAVMRFDVYAIALGSPTIGTYDAAQLRSIREALAGLDVEAIRDAVGPISDIAPR